MSSGLVGCGSREQPSAAGQSPTPSGSDRAVALAALHDESGALGLYSDLAHQNPSLRGPLGRLVAVQQRHVDALAEALGADSAGPTNTLTTGEAARAVANEATGLSARRMADCRRVESGALASMLASMGAAHAVVAEQWSRTP